MKRKAGLFLIASMLIVFPVALASPITIDVEVEDNGESEGSDLGIHFTDPGETTVAQGSRRTQTDAVIKVGDDGTVHRLDPRELGGGEPVQGTVDPELLRAAAEEGGELEVVVYVKAAVPRGSLTAAQIKSLHLPGVEASAQQIRAIERKYRPERPMTREEERAYIDTLPALEEAMDPADQERLVELRAELDRRQDAMRTALAEVAAVVSPADKQAVAAFITAAGGTVHAEAESVASVRATIPSELLLSLGAHPLVSMVVKFEPEELELNVSMPSVFFPTWWNDSPPLCGGAYDFGIVDSGVQEDHPAFSGISFYRLPGSVVTGSHGPHVAGIATSADTTYRGGAHCLDAVIWGNSGGSSGQSGTMQNMDDLVATLAQAPEVVNHSLGYGTADTTDYAPNDSFYDAFIEHFNVMVTKSTGNGGWSDTSRTITHPAPAYNLLAVANIDDKNTTSRSDDVRLNDYVGGDSSSSVGPTLSNRKKPDIAAPGENILSTNSAWATASDFISMSGTSMAAPHVGGAIVVMEDGGNHTPMAQKAVLINTADAWDSNNTRTASDDGPVSGSLWDKSYGWGYLDMSHAHFHRTDYFLDSVVPNNYNATPDDYHLYKGAMYDGDKVTMVWQKRATTYVDGGPALGQHSLSDLDLYLYDEGDGSYVDADTDVNDNVHQVAADSSTDAVIKAYAWSSSFAGASSETYALATEENFAQASPPSFSRNYTRPNYVGPYQTFDVTLRIFNSGDVAAHSNTVTLQPISGVSGGTGAHSLPSIAGGGAFQATVYTLTTNGLGAGTHYLPLDFVSYSYGETYTFNTTLGVGLIVETTPPVGVCTSAPSYDNGGSIGIGWSASDAGTGVQASYLYVKPPGGSGFSYTGLSSAGTSGSFSYTPGADGLHQFAVRSLDNGGSWEDIPTASECQTFYDTHSPSSTVSTPSIGTSGPIPISFNVTDPTPSSGLEFVDFWYRKAGQPSFSYAGVFSTSWSGTVDYTPSDGDGLYYFGSRAKDNAQNPEDMPSGNGDDSTVYDTLPPTGSVLIEGGAATTTSLLVSLGLSASDAGSGVSTMRLSNDGSSWTGWQAYSGSVAGWDLSAYGGSSAPGTKTVFAEFQDGVGRISPTVSDSIVFAPVSDLIFADGFESGDTSAWSSTAP